MRTEKKKKKKTESRINQFIIECIFSKYFEEEKEIASPRYAGPAMTSNETSHSLS